MNKFNNVLLVTGGAGFIGSAFLRILVPKYNDWYFINLDALTYAGDLNKIEIIENFPNYSFVHGSITDRDLVESLFEKYDINIVVNFAAESHVDNSIDDPESFIETNVKGTYVLLDVARKYWIKNKFERLNSNIRFLQISTDEVYGALGIEDESWTELSAIQPNSPYSASKAAAEHIAMSYFRTYGLPVIITRSSNNYGIFQNEEKLIPRLIINSFRGLQLPIYGDGKNIRDWIYVDDNINALEAVLLRGLIGEAYNISSNNEFMNVDIAKLIKSYIPSSDSDIVYVNDRLGHDYRYSIDNSKIKNLNWSPLIDIEDGLRRTIKHYEE